MPATRRLTGRQSPDQFGLNPVDAVTHFLRRAGFGPTPDDVAQATKQGLAATIRQYVDYDAVPDSLAPPDASLLKALSGQIDPLGEWWLGEMLRTSRPLQERMTLFWHGHFATANSKVRHPALMYRQNQTLRQNALGRFDDILGAVYRDPAMLIWLDGRVNTKSSPNENWGREVMELFSIGPGQYTEDDVHANSRAFTGWRLNANLDAIFLPRQHDTGVKTLLGQTGNWGADDAVRIIAAHPNTGTFLATKLWKFFASDTPPQSVIQQLAATYYRSGHSIREVVRQMFLTPEFYDLTIRSNHVKSPVDFVTHALRMLDATTIPLKGFARSLTALGQELFNPPNVGGWPGGAAWINGGSMLQRFNIASRLLGDAPGSKPTIDVQQIVKDANPNNLNDFLNTLARRLGVSFTPETRAALTAYAGGVQPGRWHVPEAAPLPSYVLNHAAGLVHLILTSPEFQIA